MEDLQDKIIELMDLFDGEVTTLDKINPPEPRKDVQDIEAINRFMRDNPPGMAGGGRIGLSQGISPKVQAMLDLITPVRQKYIDLKEAQINDPKGGTLKNFLNYENFLIKEIDSVKNTADAKKLISSTRYYLEQPEKLSTSKKRLLDNLIKIENKMPGRATPGYKLALQAGYVMKKTTKGSKTTTAPPGSFKNLLSVNDKKINRVDEVIRQLDSGQLTIDDILKEGSLTRYINKPFGFKDPESFNILIRKNKKYADRLDEFKLLNNVSFLNKYKGRGILAADASNVFEQARTGGKNFSQVAQSGPVKKILDFADRHIKRDGKLVRRIDDNTFVYNNKIFSTTPDSVDQKVLNKLGLKNKKIIDLVVDGSKQPEFKEIFNAFDKVREYETMEGTHPVTGKKTPLTKLLQEADYIAGGRDRLAAKNIFSRTPFEIDHFGSVKDDPFKNIRIIPRTINQAAGQFQRGVSTFKDIKQAEDFIGYNFTGDPLQSINNYINTEITRGQDPNYTGRATKIFSAKTKAIDKALAEAGIGNTRGGQILTSTFPENVFTDQLIGTRDKRFKQSFTDVPILERTTGDKLTIGSRPVTEKEIISVAERDAMAKKLKDRLLKLDLSFLPKKISTPLEVGQQIIKGVTKKDGGRIPYRYGKSVQSNQRGKDGKIKKIKKNLKKSAIKGLAGIDVPLMQALFASGDPTSLLFTLPFTDIASKEAGLYKPAKTKTGGIIKNILRLAPRKIAEKTFPMISRASIPVSVAYGIGEVAKAAKPNYYIDPKTGEPTFYKRDFAQNVLPGFMDLSEQAANIAKKEGISYKEALGKIDVSDFISNVQGPGKKIEPFAGGGRAGFKLGTVRKIVKTKIDEAVEQSPKDTTSALDKLIKKALDEDFFDKKDRIIDTLNAKIARERKNFPYNQQVFEEPSQLEFYDDITKSNFKTKTGPFFDYQKRKNKAGGGLLKQAGDRSGAPPVSGPNSQGLQGLLNRVKKT